MTRFSGCPWDLEQTFLSIAPYTIEEAYEVADAIERGDMADLRDESATSCCRSPFTLAWRRRQAFSISAAWSRRSRAKLIRRHPHVFADARELHPDEVKALWGRIKAEEKRLRAEARAVAGQSPEAPSGALAGAPTPCPPCPAPKLQEKAAKVGFDWNDAAR